MQQWQQDILDRHFPDCVHIKQDWLADFPEQRDKTVVHIPARAGSSRILDKNIRPLNGVPLICYTIALAKSLPVDRVIVNTDSTKIAEIAEGCGAEVPFLRPPDLSTNDSPPGAASLYLQHYLMNEGYAVETFIEMYPTTPFRNRDTLLHYLDLTHRFGHCVTTIPVETTMDGYYLRDKKVDLTNSNASRAPFWFKPFSNFIGTKFNGYELTAYNHPMITNPIELVDIDEPSDFELAEYIVANNLYDFGVKI